MGFLYSSVSKASAFNAGDLGSIPMLEKFPWRRKWQPTSVFLPGESHGQRNMAGYSSWDHKSWTQLSDIVLSAYDIEYKVYIYIIEYDYDKI